MNKKFLYNIDQLKSYLCIIKAEFDQYEYNHLDSKKRWEFLEIRKKEIFPKLDDLLELVWSDFKILPKQDFLPHKQHYEKELVPFLAEGVDTNAYIRAKPLGYAGDYVTMNFIYDYQEGKYVGSTLYAQLINNYTCNIDVAISNIYRKKYLKDKIVEYLKQEKVVEILTVGCGPAREIIELLNEGKIKNKVIFHCLDLEKNAIAFVENELKGIDFDRKRIKLNFYVTDLLELIKNKRIESLFTNVDLIYVSGVFDYLSDRLAKAVVKNLSKITRKELIVFNMSLEHARHRAYYEVFGGWVMYHRTKDEILQWTEGLDSTYQSNIIQYPQCKSYWILEVSRR